MKKQTDNFYSAPTVEVTCLAVEQGIAFSGKSSIESYSVAEEDYGW